MSVTSSDATDQAMHESEKHRVTLFCLVYFFQFRYREMRSGKALGDGPLIQRPASILQIVNDCDEIAISSLYVILSVLFHGRETGGVQDRCLAGLHDYI